MPKKKLASLHCADISNSTQLEEKNASKKKNFFFYETHCFQSQETWKASREALLSYNVTFQLSSLRTSKSQQF